METLESTQTTTSLIVEGQRTTVTAGVLQDFLSKLDKDTPLFTLKDGCMYPVEAITIESQTPVKSGWFLLGAAW